MRWNKRAIAITFETTIFIILNLVFILLLLIFVNSAGRGAFVYERAYAKQIALAIDNAEPKMTLTLNMAEAIKRAEKNNKKLEDIVKINTEENEVIVSLASRGGHSFRYFSDYDVEWEINGQRNELLVKVREKQEEAGVVESETVENENE